MPEGQGAPASPQAARGAARASARQKLAEALSSQYGLNVFVAGLLLLLAWAVHASRVAKSDLLCFLTALMLLQLLWMLWYVRRSAAQRRLIRPKDTHAGARWLRGESPPCLPPCLPPSLPPSPLPLLPHVFSLCLPARLLPLSPSTLLSSLSLGSLKDCRSLSSLRREALFDLPSVARATVTQTCSSLLGSKPRSGSADPLPEATLPVLAFTAF